MPSRPEPTRRYRRTFAVLAVAALLVSCGGDDHGFNCFDCGPGVTPVETSLGVVSGNFHGAGVADLVQLSTVEPEQGPNASNLKTYLSIAADEYGGPTLTPDGNNPLYLATADLNGDGLNDLVSASADDGVLRVFLNDKLNPGTFNTPLVLASPGASQVAIADMNGDGLPDLVSADFNVSLFLQTSPGTFAAPISLYPGGANWVAIGDLNDDGSPDIALTDNVGVKVLMHTGAASATTFAAPVAVFTQTLNQDLQGANIIAIGDVNGDGLNDLIITDPGPTGGMAPTVNVLLQEAAVTAAATHGSFAAPVSYPIAVQDVPQSIVLSDLEGDGHLDIVIGGTHTVTVLLHDPANPGQFLAATVYPAPQANEITIADVNGDGKPDIVVSNGVTFPTQDGVVTTHPGVLLQSATTPGTFGALQDLP
ncbi:MAG TPA: VCBS repeat-containing protein [Steroidobacteraceae bacterium]